MKRPEAAIILTLKMLPALLCLSGNTAAAQPPDYVIQPQDILGITVWRNQDLDTEVEVDQEGMITLPLLGKVQAGGLTPQKLEETLTRLWGENYIKNPYVRVRLQKKQFFVLGEVKEPGSFELVGNMTVLKAISMAGGFTDYAKEGSIRILRTDTGSPERIEVDIPRIQSGDVEDIEIRPGDVITVPQSFF
ncbi:MAG TPA: polysaccharide biosynthesis/export family protein [bacterium]|nr:polysaccharide biosynthesis/export family protein [bacterium]HPQ65387.1 polysaccharide biosynthesis/export family protein [bacterium]